MRPDRGGATPDVAMRRAARMLALLVSLFLPLALAGQWLFSPAGTAAVAMALTAVTGGAALAALLVLAAGGPVRLVMLPVVALLDLTAVLAGALLPVGLDIAVIVPVLGAVILVAAFNGRALWVGLFAAWIAGLAGSWLARTSPGLSAVPHVTPAPFAIAMLGVGMALGYAILGWAAEHWQAALAETAEAVRAARVAEAEQQQAAERLRAMAENSPLPTLAFDSSGLIQTWNPAAQRLLGWTSEEVIGRHVTEIVPPEMSGEVRRRVERAMTGHLPGPRITRFLTRDGGEVRAEVYDGLERDREGRPSGIVVQFLDLTEREDIAARMVEAQRLEAVGQLAGGIAHDFNNSLTAIAGFASLIASGDSPDPRDDARTILGAAEHAATLTRQLLAFARRVPLQPQVVDLREFLAAIGPLTRSLLGETIAVRLETGTEPALVEVDPPSLEQAILNLAANARDAMPQGGELMLGVCHYPACQGDGNGTPEAHVAVRVSDTGGGIPAYALAHVFEPFFTTKPVGKGTGLGLAMVHGFTEESGGHVVVTSLPGQGATVELHFPSVAGATPQARVYAEPVGGTDSILFVEDDPSVASFGLACLRRLGYDVTPALNGAEAVALASSREKPFDLLLTDVVIPGMSGPELAGLIHRHHPTTAILYASGYSAEHVSQHVPGPPGPLLEKPYSQAQLAARVREVLDARAGREGARTAEVDG
jgi:two-component system, cell cycle sensor histidine kinase and response regulator CckA